MSSTKPTKRKKAYACDFRDGRVETYDTWKDAQTASKTVPCSYARGFESVEDANQWVARKRQKRGVATPVFIVYSDGSCYDNGSKTSATGGIGVYWGDEHPQNVSEAIPKNPPPTNNRAELLAAERALYQWKEMLADSDRPESMRMVLCTDSSYTINAMEHWYEEWVENKKVDEKVNIDIIERLYNLFNEVKDTVRIEYVPGHAGLRGNEMADKLSKDAARPIVGPPE